MFVFALSRAIRLMALTPLVFLLGGVGGIQVALGSDAARQSNEADCKPWRSDYADKPDLTVGDIHIKTADVFDTGLSGESAWYHRITNRLHIITHPDVIAYQLLFRTGDTLSLELLEESARLLRANRSIQEASVEPVSLCGNRVTIAVHTKDHWTFTPSLVYKQAGGVRTVALEVQELNLFGFNKELKFAYESTDEDTETLFRYRDKNLFGSRYQLTLAHETLNGRDAWQFGFALPAFTDSAGHSWGFIAEDARKLSRDVLVNERRALSRISRTEAWYLQRLPMSDAIYRAGGGWRVERESYTVDGINMIETEPFEYDYSYPYLTFQYLAPDYATYENLYSIGRTEDINTGIRFAIETGLITEALGNDENTVRLGMTLANGWTLGSSTLAVARLSVRDYLQTDRYAIGLKATAFQRFDDRNLLQLDLNLQRRSGFSADHHYTIGGEAGLKGFPDQHQRGNQRAIGAVEFRHILDYYPLRLFRLAISGFYEVGAAWTQQEPRNWLHDIGAGLAISPTRTSTHDLLRLDIAIPVTDNNDLRDYQIYFGTQINY